MDKPGHPFDSTHDNAALFDDTELYRQVNSDAHKEIPCKLTCPALTWHMAFLIPRNAPVEGIDTRERVKCILDRTLVRFMRHLQLVGMFENAEPLIEDRYILFRRCVDADLKRVRQADCTSRQLAVLNADQRLIQVEFKWALSTISVRIQLQVNFFTITIITQLGERHTVLNDQEKTLKTGIYLEQYQQELTIGFWNEFTVFLFSLRKMDFLFQHEIFQHIFVDLRGVILSDESLDLPEVKPLAQGRLDPWASDLVTRISPSINFADRFECSASYMLNRRAIFLTALGPQPPSLPASKRLPTTFLLCLSRGTVVGVKQLGRAVDRLHSAETFRLAALLDLSLLRVAGDKLSLVDAAIQRARKSVDDFENRLVGTKEMRGAVAAAQNVIDEIAISFIGASPARAGLTFRIESARYYVSQFRRGMPSLRLGRVEGFQRYDLFVERRLGPTFEYIDRLGIRYDRGLQVMRSINQRYLSTTIATMNELSTTTGISVEKLQRDGAAFLIGILLPYYMMGSFHYFFTELSRLQRILFTPIIITLWTLAVFQLDYTYQKLKYAKHVKQLILRVIFVEIILILILFLIPASGAPK